jgi:hypothetical protein
MWNRPESDGSYHQLICSFPLSYSESSSRYFLGKISERVFDN